MLSVACSGVVRMVPYLPGVVSVCTQQEMGALRWDDYKEERMCRDTIQGYKKTQAIVEAALEIKGESYGMMSSHEYH